jgi:hypothetical protein
MSEDVPVADDADESRRLLRHLAALVGALQGPADLGANHDAYLTYSDTDGSSGGAASA